MGWSRRLVSHPLIDGNATPGGGNKREKGPGCALRGANGRLVWDGGKAGGPGGEGGGLDEGGRVRKTLGCALRRTYRRVECVGGRDSGTRYVAIADECGCLGEISGVTSRLQRAEEGVGKEIHLSW